MKIKDVLAILFVVSAFVVSTSCSENPDEKARKDLETKIASLESAPVSNFSVKESVIAFRNKSFTEREQFEKSKKGNRVTLDVTVRSIARYDSGIKGASGEYFEISTRPSDALENTFIDILVPRSAIEGIQENQKLSVTGFVKYLTLGGDGHMILFPAKISGAGK